MTGPFINVKYCMKVNNCILILYQNQFTPLHYKTTLTSKKLKSGACKHGNETDQGPLIFCIERNQCFQLLYYNIILFSYFYILSHTII